MNRYLYIVEGQNDISKLKSLGAHFVMKTEGYLVSNQFRGFLKRAEQVRKIVLVLDPDGPGNKIRETLHKTLTNYEDVMIDKKRATGNRKVGVAETDINYLKKILEPYLKADLASEEKDTFDFSSLFALRLAGSDSSLNKDKLKRKLSLVITTGRSIVDELNILLLTEKQVKEILK